MSSFFLIVGLASTSLPPSRLTQNNMPVSPPVPPMSMPSSSAFPPQVPSSFFGSGPAAPSPESIGLMSSLDGTVEQMQAQMTEGQNLLGSLDAGNRDEVAGYGGHAGSDALMGDEGAHLKRSFTETKDQSQPEPVRSRTQSSLARAAAQARNTVAPTVSSDTATSDDVLEAAMMHEMEMINNTDLSDSDSYG